MRKERIHVCLDEDTMKAIKKEAAIRSVAVSQVIREMIRSSIDG